jgi:hypothetical protein
MKRLKISLPNCPKGRLFKETIDGDFFHSMTDEEAISGNFKFYKFTKKEIDENPEWFEDELLAVVTGKVLDAKNFSADILAEGYNVLFGEDHKPYWLVNDKARDIFSIMRGGTQPCCDYKNWVNFICFLAKHTK